MEEGGGALCFETFPIAAGVENVHVGFYSLFFFFCQTRASCCLELVEEGSVMELWRTDLYACMHVCVRVCFAEI